MTDSAARLLYAFAALLGRLPWPWLLRLGDGWRRWWLLARRAREPRSRGATSSWPTPTCCRRSATQLHRAILRTTARQALETAAPVDPPARARTSRLIREHARHRAVRRGDRRRPRRDRRRAALRQLGTAEPVAGLRARRWRSCIARPSRRSARPSCAWRAAPATTTVASTQVRAEGPGDPPAVQAPATTAAWSASCPTSSRRSATASSRRSSACRR